MAKSFIGGIHPPQRKDATAALQIERMSPPKTVAIPLQQHIGVMCDSLVAVGDRVLMGQKIGDSSAPISAPVHSSVSGKVVAIEERPHPNGRKVLAVVIENDFTDEIVAGAAPKPSVEQLSAEQLTQYIREAGIVGMGGGGFPTHAKLKPPQGVVLDAVLLNGAECEPYLTADHRVMVEWADEVIYGLRCLMKAANVDKGFVGVEANKPDAIEALRVASNNFSNIQILELSVKYPQGAEIQLIDVCLGRKVPSGKLPLHVGVVVNNVHTAQAVARSLRTGLPSIERVITVSGSCVENPANLLVRVGTSFADILTARGLKCEPHKLIAGGPMMGMAMYSSDAVICKCSSSVLALSKNETSTSEDGTCVRCAKCVDACPMLLHPTFIAQYAELGMIENAEEYGAMDCRECGVCTYVCPAHLPLTQRIRLAKSDIYAKRK